jgi:hypothetical protein
VVYGTSSGQPQQKAFHGGGPSKVKFAPTRPYAHVNEDEQIIRLTPEQVYQLSQLQSQNSQTRFPNPQARQDIISKPQLNRPTALTGPSISQPTQLRMPIYRQQMEVSQVPMTESNSGQLIPFDNFKNGQTEVDKEISNESPMSIQESAQNV